VKGHRNGRVIENNLANIIYEKEGLLLLSHTELH
jgi:hypothetical protein